MQKIDYFLIGLFLSFSVWNIRENAVADCLNRRYLTGTEEDTKRRLIYICAKQDREREKERGDIQKSVTCRRPTCLQKEGEGEREWKRKPGSSEQNRNKERETEKEQRKFLWSLSCTSPRMPAIWHHAVIPCDDYECLPDCAQWNGACHSRLYSMEVPCVLLLHHHLSRIRIIGVLNRERYRQWSTAVKYNVVYTIFYLLFFYHLPPRFHVS